MEQIPSWEPNSHSASQEIPHLLCNPKVHYCVHKSLPVVHIPSQMNPAHIFPPHFPKIHYNITFFKVVECDKEHKNDEVSDKRKGEKIILKKQVQR